MCLEDGENRFEHCGKVEQYNTGDENKQGKITCETF